MSVAMVGAVVGVAGTAYSASQAGKGGGSGGSQTVTNKVELDPEIRNILYGTGRRLRDGVTPTYDETTTAGTTLTPAQEMERQSYLNNGIQPPDHLNVTGPSTSRTMINPESDYINDTGLLGRINGLLDEKQAGGMDAFGRTMDNYVGLQGIQDVTMMRNAAHGLMYGDILSPWQKGSKIEAPGQNDVNLRPAYEDMIYGEAGNNPYLTGAIQKGINQSTNAYSDMLGDTVEGLNDAFANNRQGAIINGAMGSSRQGIADSKAFDSAYKHLGRSMTRFGQGNTDAAVGAQAGAYDTDRSRALSAMQGLGGQQYQVAGQNATMDQQQRLMNQQLDMQAQQLRSQNVANGLSANSGLLNQAYTFAGNNDAYNMNKVNQVAGMVQPFTGIGSTSVQSQPLYGNKAGNIAGAVTAGAGLLGNISNSYQTPNYAGYQQPTHGPGGSYLDNPFQANYI